LTNVSLTNVFTEFQYIWSAAALGDTPSLDFWVLPPAQASRVTVSGLVPHPLSLARALRRETAVVRSSVASTSRSSSHPTPNAPRP
jgi:hypothetical protein